ncbi:MAG: hypothetical protein WCP35_12100 [Verrucomicrobiota bacterium]
MNRMNYRRSATVALCLCLFAVSPLRAEVWDQDDHSGKSTERLFKEIEESYGFRVRRVLTLTLASRGMGVMPDLIRALDHKHWHVRQAGVYAMMVLCYPEIRKQDDSTGLLNSIPGPWQNPVPPAAVKEILPALPRLEQMVEKDPHHWVRTCTAQLLCMMGKDAMPAKMGLFRAASNDPCWWVRLCAGSALDRASSGTDSKWLVAIAMIPSRKDQVRVVGAGRLVNWMERTKLPKGQQMYVAPPEGEMRSLLVKAMKEALLAPTFDKLENQQRCRTKLATILEKDLGVDVKDIAPGVAALLKEEAFGDCHLQTLECLEVFGADLAPAEATLREMLVAEKAKVGKWGRPAGMVERIEKLLETITKEKS